MRKLNKLLQKISVGIAATAIGIASAAMPALAAITIVVTPSDMQGWSEADTRPGGDVNFVADSEAPGGSGALQLTTDSTTTAKAQFMHLADESTQLSDVTELSYSTKQTSAEFEDGAPSYQLPVDLNGSAAGGFTTFVYEPYQNGDVSADLWQSWDVDAGQFWSSRSFDESGCAVVAGGGGAPFYTLEDINSMCPDAVVLGFGVNIGSNNPSYDVSADLVNFDGTVFDFELFATPKNKEQCKKDGWKDLKDSSGNAFKNQGQCVSYFNNTQ